MKSLLIILLILNITINNKPVYAKSFKERYSELKSNNDTTSQKLFLEEWEKADNNDPELYVAYFNYFINKSKNELIEIGNNPKGEYVLSLMETDTTKTEPVGYIYGNTKYDSLLLKKGFDYIDLGISKNPTRLDMRFGKIYMLGLLGDFKTFTNEIIKSIDYSIKIGNKWTWTDNNPVDGDPKEFMLSSIQDYQLQLYNTSDNNLLENMKQIAETILNYYPNHVESLSNLSIVYLINNDFDKALVSLLKAEIIAPTDYIVLSNIAHAYKQKGDNKNAINYYEQTLKYGNDEVKEFAKQQIEELKNK